MSTSTMRTLLNVVVLSAMLLSAVVLWTRPTNLGPLPNMKLEGLTGDAQTVTLDDLKGKVALINFWGTWCGPCQVEFPHIVELQRAYSGNHDVKVLAVSCDGGHDDDVPAVRHTTQKFLHDQGVDHFPTYIDHARVAREALAGVGAFQGSYPTTLIVDRAGIIRGTWVGYRPGSEVAMSGMIAQLLKEPTKDK